MVLDLYLVRHGETVGNRSGLISGATDDRLTPRGVRQAHLRGFSLQGEGITRIVSSPVYRTRKTANIIRRYIPGLTIREDPLWTEMGFGDLEGEKSFKEYLALRQAVLRQNPSLNLLDWKPLGGESLRDLYERAGEALDKLVWDYDGDRVLVVTHGGVMSMAMIHLNGRPLSWENYRVFLPHTNCVLTRAVHDDSGWGLEIVNAPVVEIPESSENSLRASQ